MRGSSMAPNMSLPAAQIKAIFDFNIGFHCEKARQQLVNRLATPPAVHIGIAKCQTAIVKHTPEYTGIMNPEVPGTCAVYFDISRLAKFWCKRWDFAGHFGPYYFFPAHLIQSSTNTVHAVKSTIGKVIRRLRRYGRGRLLRPSACRSFCVWSHRG